MDAALRAGIALYNAGEYHAAHDPWEDRWLRLDAGDDERFLQALIQFTAATHHARQRNWSGATGLATSARDYLTGLGTRYRTVDLAPLRRWLRALAADPAVVERRGPPPLRHGDVPPGLDDLRFEAAALAASALAEEHGFDPTVIDRAVAFARQEIADGDGSLFASTLLAFVTAGEARPLVHRRLEGHVDRREREYTDVAGLFDED